MQKLKRHWIVVTCSLLVIVLLAGWLAKRAWNARHAPAYLTAKVIRGEIENSVLAIGNLEAYKQVDVGVRTSGQLKSLKVELGDTVKKDQLLAELDPSQLQNQLRAKQIEKEILDLQQKERKAELWSAKLSYQRQHRLLRQDSTSRQDFEAARSKWLALKANLASLRAQSKKAQAEIEIAKTELNYTRITAPIAGEVVAIVTREGQTVIAQQQAPVILKLADLRTMTVKIQVPEADVIRISAGQTAYFTILGEPKQRFYGKLRTIEAAPQNFLENQTSNSNSQNSAAVFYNASFDIPNPKRQLRIGMTAETHILLDKASDALIIPTAALSAPDQQRSYTVRVLSPRQQVQTRKVRIGLNNNVKAQVLEGLKEGEQVIIGEPANSDEEN